MLNTVTSAKNVGEKLFIYLKDYLQNLVHVSNNFIKIPGRVTSESVAKIIKVFYLTIA